MNKIEITSNVFLHNKKIPIDYSCNGRNISPALSLSEISNKAKSIAIIMDDIKHPLFKVYNHWVIWNLPVMREIPENIPHGKILSDLEDAVQGIRYGHHKYRGPKPPFNTSHLYQYNVYVLDTRLDLKPQSKKKHLIASMDGHILQYGFIVGEYK